MTLLSAAGAHNIRIKYTIPSSYPHNNSTTKRPGERIIVLRNLHEVWPQYKSTD